MVENMIEGQMYWTGFTHPEHPEELKAPWQGVLKRVEPYAGNPFILVHPDFPEVEMQVMDHDLFGTREEAKEDLINEILRIAQEINQDMLAIITRVKELMEE